ncbi:hypothetical protein BGZ65_008982, partial [Modicella reniformis]
MDSKNPLHILEIIEEIVKFLTRKDLVHCLRVSKTFYTATIPCLWTILKIRKERIRKFPLKPELQKYKHHIDTI